MQTHSHTEAYIGMHSNKQIHGYIHKQDTRKQIPKKKTQTYTHR